MSSLQEVLADLNQSDGASLDFERDLYNALITGTRASNALPGANDDYAYYSSLPEFKDRVDSFRNRLVNLIYQFAARVDSSDELFKLHELIAADPADVDAFEPIADVVDLLLENVDSYLEEAQGNKNQNKNLAVSKSQLVRGLKAGLNGIITHADIPKPQQNFEDEINNSSQPFQPKLKSKPNRIVPIPDGGYVPVLAEDRGSYYSQDEPKSLGLSLIEAHVRNMGVDVDKHSQPRYPNPYEVEIKTALGQPPPWIFQKATPEKPAPMSSTVCKWVDTKNGLSKLCSDLEGESILAVDLENHSYRSYQGFVCLMQVSTYKMDYIIDTLALRSHMYLLNGVFTNPKIVKVFHGSDSDILWLQRDFGLYVVSLFDTGQAARVLGYPSAGLAYALYRHCNINANKAFQLADWRLRPLPEDMLQYARQDTHFLLYIFGNMKNELLSQTHEGDPFAYMQKVLRKSTGIALSTYEKEIITPTSFKSMIKTRKLSLSKVQTQVLQKVFDWRDTTAREQDESPQYVLPQRMLIRIAMELPRSTAELERCCDPCPPLVKSKMLEVLQAVEAGIKPSDLPEPGNIWEQKAREAAAAANSKPPLNNIAPSSTIAVNSRSTSFVPIGLQREGVSKTKAGVSFAEAAAAGTARGNIQSNDRTAALRSAEMSARATPSPVLTTEQLYDTAGWQDVSDPSWRKAVANQPYVQTGRQQPGVFGQLSDGYGASTDRSLADRADETRRSIGQEVLQAGSKQRKTPFAAMATAMANSYNKEGEPSSAATMSTSRTEESTETPMDTSVAEDDVIDIDTPANADALESDDIPRSMAEIYRISNRNRKRNKEKKKMKDETQQPAGDQGSTQKAPNATNTADPRKRHKNTASQGAAGSREPDDAIGFMRNIGWVDRQSTPVANLVVEGAPLNQPKHLAGALGPDVNGEANAHNKGSNKPNGGGQKSRGRHVKGPSSPRRRHNGRGGAGGQYYHHNKQSGNPTAQGRHQQGGTPGGFSYSQAAANAAGVKWSDHSANGPRDKSQGRPGRGRGGRGGTGNNVYYGSRSMSYKS